MEGRVFQWRPPFTSTVAMSRSACVPPPSTASSTYTSSPSTCSPSTSSPSTSRPSASSPSTSSLFTSSPPTAAARPRLSVKLQILFALFVTLTASVNCDYYKTHKYLRGNYVELQPSHHHKYSDKYVAKDGGVYNCKGEAECTEVAVDELDRADEFKYTSTVSTFPIASHRLMSSKNEKRQKQSSQEAINGSIERRLNYSNLAQHNADKLMRVQSTKSTRNRRPVRPQITEQLLKDRLTLCEEVKNGNFNLDGWELMQESERCTFWRRRLSGSHMFEYVARGRFDDVSVAAYNKTVNDVKFRKSWDDATDEIYLVESYIAEDDDENDDTSSVHKEKNDYPTTIQLTSNGLPSNEDGASPRSTTVLETQHYQSTSRIGSPTTSTEINENYLSVLPEEPPHFFSSSTKTRGPPELEEIIYWRFRMPWPFPNRDFVYSRRIKCYQHRNAIISVEESAKHPECPEMKKFVRIVNFSSTLALFPTNPTQDMQKPGMEYVMFHADDPRVNLPDWVTSYVVTQLLPTSIKSLHSTALKLVDSFKEVPLPTIRNTTTLELTSPFSPQSSAEEPTSPYVTPSTAPMEANSKDIISPQVEASLEHSERKLSTQHSYRPHNTKETTQNKRDAITSIASAMPTKLTHSFLNHYSEDKQHATEKLRSLTHGMHCTPTLFITPLLSSRGNAGSTAYTHKSGVSTKTHLYRLPSLQLLDLSNADPPLSITDTMVKSEIHQRTFGCLPLVVLPPKSCSTNSCTESPSINCNAMFTPLWFQRWMANSILSDCVYDCSVDCIANARVPVKELSKLYNDVVVDRRKRRGVEAPQRRKMMNATDFMDDITQQHKIHSLYMLDDIFQ